MTAVERSTENEPMPNVVLALMAHPDDAEILCGGTLLQLADRNWQVHLACAATGHCGSSTLPGEEIARIRAEEAKEAAAKLGGLHHSLGLPDLEVVYNADSLRRATALLREVRPQVVLTHAPSDYMVDHEQTSLLARAAAFAAPIPNACGLDPAAAPPLAAIPHLYYADPIEGRDPLGREVAPNVLIDITSTIDRKLDLVACHASQRAWLRTHHGEDEYLDSVRRWSAKRGRAVGVEFGEGFRQHLGHAYPQDDILTRELAAR